MDPEEERNLRDEINQELRKQAKELRNLAQELRELSRGMEAPQKPAERFLDPYASFWNPPKVQPGVRWMTIEEWMAKHGRRWFIWQETERLKDEFWLKEIGIRP